MREIKFRAWDRDSRKMKEGCPVVSHFKNGCFGIDGGDEHGFDLMQYTGLQDNNGKDIYEGDVVTTEGDFGTEQYSDCRKITETVEYNGGAFYPICEQPPENFIVIGNIYENPELI